MGLGLGLGFVGFIFAPELLAVVSPRNPGGNGVDSKKTPLLFAAFARLASSSSSSSASMSVHGSGSNSILWVVCVKAFESCVCEKMWGKNSSAVLDVEETLDDLMVLFGARWTFGMFKRFRRRQMGPLKGSAV